MERMTWNSVTKRIVFAFAILFVPAILYAECNGGSCVNVKIEELQVSKGGNIYVRTTGTETQLSCTPEANVFLILDGLTGGGKNVFAALLSAQTRDIALTVRIVDSVNPCTIAYVSVS